jgi:hypothetical protein
MSWMDSLARPLKPGGHAPQVTLADATAYAPVPSLTRAPSQWCPFACELRYTLTLGDP